MIYLHPHMTLKTAAYFLRLSGYRFVNLRRNGASDLRRNGATTKY